MDRNEFLNQLRQSLSGEVDADVIEQNIRYYDQYINTGSKEDEERVLNELGDPRLIAKTIIESDRIAKQKGNYSGNPGSQYESFESHREEDDPDWEQKWEQQNSGIHPKAFFTNLKWYHKLSLIFIIIALVLVLVLLGRFLVTIMFTIGYPLILIILVMILFRKRR